MALRSDIDPDGLLEYSVVYTDRALNHMSKTFMQVMQDLSHELKSLYHAHAVAIVPGSGTAGMEAVARALAKDQECVVIRNGWFSYRWTQILQMGDIAKSSQVFCANQVDLGRVAFVPTPIDEVMAYIHKAKPKVVFAPHVETASGMMLSEDYIKQLADAVHSVDGLLVIDCIASGCVWLDMQDLGIDVLLSAPQKGLSGTPCAGLVMLSKQACQVVADSMPSSFMLNLKAWLDVMRAYENGGHAYHATMPTDGLRQLRDTLLEAKAIGYQTLKDAQIQLGRQTLQALQQHGMVSVAHPDYQAWGVLVCHADDEAMHKGVAFAKQGVQIAAGVPLQVGEPDDYRSFRIGLFGLDKLIDVSGTVARLEQALKKMSK